MDRFYVDRTGCASGVLGSGSAIGEQFAKARAYEQEAMSKCESSFATPVLNLHSVFDVLRETQEMVDRAINRSGASADVLVGHEPENGACGGVEASRPVSGAIEALHERALGILRSVHRLHDHLGRIERGVGL